MVFKNQIDIVFQGIIFQKRHRDDIWKRGLTKP